jgi:hypothetical protein
MSMWTEMVESSPQLRRGTVWCTKCGRTQSVNSVECLKHGWPKCCGLTMTVDNPEERAGLAKVAPPPMEKQ